MEANITNYAANAPTYFTDLANEYDTLTGTSTSVTAMSTTSTTSTDLNLSGYLPFVENESITGTSSTYTY
ncbi:hypothetical protein J6W20_00520 [bacterium]|nr:hypothetical protein [bacterium]